MLDAVKPTINQKGYAMTTPDSTHTPKVDPSNYSIGGQAIVEGVMMRGKYIYSLAIRKPDSTIHIENHEVKNSSKESKIRKLPIIRGIFAFINSMIIGIKIMTRSAEIAGEFDDEQPSKFEKYLEAKFGDKLTDILVFLSLIIALAFSVTLFMLLPVVITSFLNRFLGIQTWALGISEGLVRICIFLAYIYMISKLKDIQRVFMYHGAEHKTINCHESNEDLTVENVMKHSRLHKRCGTSFLLIVMAISMLVFMFVRTDVVLYRLVSRVLLVPIIAGMSYEIIRWAGKSDSVFVNIVSKPGLALQKLTTREPDAEQIECAIAAMNEVLQNDKK